MSNESHVRRQCLFSADWPLRVKYCDRDEVLGYIQTPKAGTAFRGIPIVRRLHNISAIADSGCPVGGLGLVRVSVVE